MVTPAISAPSALEVRLGGRQVATLSRLPGDVVTLFFEPSYVEDERRPTLSWGFHDAYGRLRVRQDPTHGSIPPFFANLLPEGELRRYVAYRAGIALDDDFGLLWVTGDDLPGAVTVHDPHGRPLPPPAEGGPEFAPPETDLLRFSLAGVQLKFSAIDKATGGLTIRAHGQGGDRIVKLPSTHFPSVPENEFAMLQFARTVGISVPEIRLVPIEQIAGMPDEARGLVGSALSVERFDRPTPNVKVHIEDLNQVYRQYPRAKYEYKSFANVAETIYQTIGNDALIDFVQRVVFNIGIGNNDMHLKNWSFIYPDGRTPKLAPAYDYICTKVYLKHNQTGLLVGSARYFPQVTIEQMEHLAKRARVSTGIVVTAANEMVNRMREAWPGVKDSVPFPEMAASIDEQFQRVPLFNPNTSIVPSAALPDEPHEEIA